MISSLQDQLQSMQRRLNHEREHCAKLEQAYKERNAWLASKKQPTAGDGPASAGGSVENSPLPSAAASTAAAAAAAVAAAAAPVALSILPKTDETLVEVQCPTQRA